MKNPKLVKAGIEGPERSRALGSRRGILSLLALLALAVLATAAVTSCSDDDSDTASTESTIEEADPQGEDTVSGEVTAAAYATTGTDVGPDPSAVVVTLEDGEEVFVALSADDLIEDTEEWFVTPLQEGQGIVGRDDLVGGANVELRDVEGVWEIVAVDGD